MRKEATARQHTLIFTGLAAMACGLFAGRAALSLATGLFVVAACFHARFGQQARTFAASPPAVALSLLFLIPLFSGLWSGDSAAWLNVVQIKLPLLLLPLAFAGQWQLPEERWRHLCGLVIALVVCGTVWSVANYFSDKQLIHEAYLKAKLIRTPLANDHVRFSWLVNAAILSCLLLWRKGASKSGRIVLAAVTVWLVAYLHLLSARTGLLCFYFMMTAFALRHLLLQKRKALPIAALGAVVALPLTAWFTLPTFANRVRYLRWDLGQAFDAVYLPGSNDGNRTLSLQAGWDVLRGNFFGVGAGDVRRAANGWYAAHVPGMWPQDRLLPSSEWLVYGCAAGWLGMVLFTAAMAVPFFAGPMRTVDAGLVERRRRRESGAAGRARLAGPANPMSLSHQPTFRRFFWWVPNATPVLNLTAVRGVLAPHSQSVASGDAGKPAADASGKPQDPLSNKGVPRRLFWWMLNATLVLNLLFDPGLEVQYGVFLHAFFVLWWYKWLGAEKSK